MSKEIKALSDDANLEIVEQALNDLYKVHTQNLSFLNELAKINSSILNNPDTYTALRLSASIMKEITELKMMIYEMRKTAKIMGVDVVELGNALEPLWASVSEVDSLVEEAEAILPPFVGLLEKQLNKQLNKQLISAQGDRSEPLH